MDVLKEKIDVRRAIIHDIRGTGISSPKRRLPSGPPISGKTPGLPATHLTRKGDQLHRWGFSGKIEEIIREYPH